MINCQKDHEIIYMQLYVTYIHMNECETFCSICGIPILVQNYEYMQWTHDVTLLPAIGQNVCLNTNYSKMKYDPQGLILKDNIKYFIKKLNHCYIKNHCILNIDFFNQTGINYYIYDSSEQNIEAFPIHTSCYQIILQNFKYKLKFKDLYQLLNNECCKDWRLVSNMYSANYENIANGDSFDFSKVTKDDKIMLSNPIDEPKNKSRIIGIWNNFMPYIKMYDCDQSTFTSPCMPATNYESGTIKYGNDGKLWIVVQKSSMIWEKLNKHNVKVYFERRVKQQKSTVSVEHIHNRKNVR